MADEATEIRGVMRRTDDGEQVYEVRPEDRADFHRAVQEGRPIRFVADGDITRLVD